MAQLIDILAVGVTGDDGAVLSSGTVDFYLAGTTTRQTVYSDNDLLNPLTNPATLDAAGRLVAYTTASLKLVISDSDGAVVRTIENVQYHRGNIISTEIGADQIKSVNMNSDVAGDGLGQDDNGALEVNVDDSTIEINADTLRVKDGGITQAKRADLGQQISSGSGTSYTNTGNTYTLVTNCTVDITTTGRPVFVGLISNKTSEPASGSSHVGVFYATVGSGTKEQADFFVSFRRDSTVLAVTSPLVSQSDDATQTATAIMLPGSCFWHIDVPSAGTYTYSVYAMPFTTSVTLSAYDLKLVAYEL